MDFTDNFLTEFRKTIKEILLEGDLERLNLAKQFLGFDNKVFGSFVQGRLAFDPTPLNTLPRDRFQPYCGIFRRPQALV